MAKKDKGEKQDSKTKSWKYIAPKAGEPDTKTVKNMNGQQEKHYWCGHAACHCWTLSHSTTGHDMQGRKGDPLKAGNRKLQGSLKTFLAQSSDGKTKLSKKECKQLQALLTTMNHDEDSKANGSVEVD
jgi:hypothetical protein